MDVVRFTTASKLFVDNRCPYALVNMVPSNAAVDLYKRTHPPSDSSTGSVTSIILYVYTCSQI